MATKSAAMDKKTLARVLNEEEFVALPKYKHSVGKVCDKFPDGVPAELAAEGLGMTVAEYDAEYDEIVRTLRQKLQA